MLDVFEVFCVVGMQKTNIDLKISILAIFRVGVVGSIPAVTTGLFLAGWLRPARSNPSRKHVFDGGHLLNPKQKMDDTDEIRTRAGRAHWLSKPTP